MFLEKPEEQLTGHRDHNRTGHYVVPTKYHVLRNGEYAVGQVSRN